MDYPALPGGFAAGGPIDLLRRTIATQWPII
jgi:hypothetical protein